MWLQWLMPTQETRNLFFKLFLIIRLLNSIHIKKWWRDRNISIDHYWYETVIGSLDDKITQITGILLLALRIQIVFWAPCFLFRSGGTKVINDLSRTPRKINSEEGLLLLSTWPIFCQNDIPDYGYYYRCSVFNSQVSWLWRKVWSVSRKVSIYMSELNKYIKDSIYL